MGKKIKCPICERKISRNLELCKFCGTDLSMEERLIPKRREEYKLERAKTLFRGNEPFIALAYLIEILEENPQSIAALELAGTIFNKIWLHPKGLEMFNKLVTIEPTNSEAWKNIALCYLKICEYQKSIDAANTCLKYDPENCDAHFIIGDSHRFLRNYNSAIDCYKKALKINPIHKKAAQSYVSIVKNTGTEQQKREWCEFLYREVIKISPTIPYNWDGKGIQFYSFGTVEQNIEDLQSRIDIFLDLNQFILESINFFIIEQQMIVSIEEYPYAFKEFKEIYNVKLIKFGRKPIKL